MSLSASKIAASVTPSILQFSIFGDELFEKFNPTPKLFILNPTTSVLESSPEFADIADKSAAYGSPAFDIMVCSFPKRERTLIHLPRRSIAS